MFSQIRPPPEYSLDILSHLKLMGGDIIYMPTPDVYLHPTTPGLVPIEGISDIFPFLEYHKHLATIHCITCGVLFDYRGNENRFLKRLWDKHLLNNHRTCVDNLKHSLRHYKKNNFKEAMERFLRSETFKCAYDGGQAKLATLFSSYRDNPAALLPPIHGLKLHRGIRCDLCSNGLFSADKVHKVQRHMKDKHDKDVNVDDKTQPESTTFVYYQKIPFPEPNIMIQIVIDPHYLQCQGSAATYKTGGSGQSGAESSVVKELTLAEEFLSGGAVGQGGAAGRVAQNERASDVNTTYRLLGLNDVFPTSCFQVGQSIAGDNVEREEIKSLFFGTQQTLRPHFLELCTSLVNQTSTLDLRRFVLSVTEAGIPNQRKDYFCDVQEESTKLKYCAYAADLTSYACVLCVPSLREMVGEIPRELLPTQQESELVVPKAKYYYEIHKQGGFGPQVHQVKLGALLALLEALLFQTLHPFSQGHRNLVTAFSLFRSGRTGSVVILDRQTTSFMAAIEFVSRVLCLSVASRSVHDLERLPKEDSSAYNRRMTDVSKDIISNLLGPNTLMAQFGTLKGTIYKHLPNDGDVVQVRPCRNGEFDVGGVKFSIKMMQIWVMELFSFMKNALVELAYDYKFSAIDLSHLVDDTHDTTVGVSLLSQNNLEKEYILFHKHLLECTEGNEQDWMNDFLAKCDSFLDALSSLAMVAAGAPVRTGSLNAVQLRNTPSKARSLICIDGSIVFRLDYGKTSQLKGSDEATYRSFPDSMGALLVEFLVYVRPVQIYVASLVHHQSQLESPGATTMRGVMQDFLFTKQDQRMTDGMMNKAFSSSAKSCTGKADVSVRKYRHFGQFLQKRYLDPSAGFLESLKNQLGAVGTALNAQMNHSDITGAVVYGNYIKELSKDASQIQLHASSLWHRLVCPQKLLDFPKASPAQQLIAPEPPMLPRAEVRNWFSGASSVAASVW